MMSVKEKIGAGKPEQKSRRRKARAEKPGMGKSREKKRKKTGNEERNNEDEGKDRICNGK